MSATTGAQIIKATPLRGGNLVLGFLSAVATVSGNPVKRGRGGFFAPLLLLDGWPQPCCGPQVLRDAWI